MSKTVLVAVVWLASVAGAWYLGGAGRSEGSGEAAPLGRGSETAGPARGATPPTLAGGAARGEVGPSSAPDRAAAPEAPASFVLPGSEGSLSTIDLANLGTADEAMGKLMAYARAKLAEGEAGHLELLKTLDALVRSKQLEAMFGSDESAVRYLYPWIKFLVENDRQVAGFHETLFKTMAEDPKALEGIDDDVLEPFTEGLSMALPGVLPEERMERLRGWARTILATPEGSLPEAIEKNRRDIARALQAWAPPVTPEEAAERLRSGSVDPSEAIALIRRVPPEVLQQVDLAAILGPVIEQGDYRALRALSGLPLDKGTLAALDARVYRTAEKREPWWISQYASSTGRRAWADARPFVDGGLRYGGGTTDAFAKALINLQDRPPKEYVVEVLETYTLSEQAQHWLRGNFGLNPPAPR